jgi:hypothetical protein
MYKENEKQIKLRDILKLSNYKPIIGSKRSKTYFIVFIKNKDME